MVLLYHKRVEKGRKNRDFLRHFIAGGRASLWLEVGRLAAQDSSRASPQKIPKSIWDFYSAPTRYETFGFTLPHASHTEIKNNPLQGFFFISGASGGSRNLIPSLENLYTNRCTTLACGAGDWNRTSDLLDHNQTL